jgi:hypothetical protein
LAAFFAGAALLAVVFFEVVVGCVAASVATGHRVA